MNVRGGTVTVAAAGLSLPVPSFSNVAAGFDWV